MGKFALIGCFGGLQILILTVMAANIYWSITTMNDVAKVQEAAEGVFRDVSVFEQTQNAIGRDVAQLNKELGVHIGGIRALVGNLPATPEIVNATLHRLEAEAG